METKEQTKDFALMLRESSARYLPENLDTVEAHQSLLKQLAQVIPPVSACLGKAERDYWPMVEQGKLPADKLGRLCATDVCNIIRITKVVNLNLEGQTEESLLKTWAGLNYYCEKLEKNQSMPLRQLLEQMTGILKEKDDTRHKVEELAALISEMERLEEERTEAGAAEGKPEVTGQTGKKKKPLWMLAIPAAVIALVLILMPVLNKVSTAEKKIDAIGTVSLSSGEAIAAAEEAYSDLNENQKAKVENYADLTEARIAYECLVTEEAINSIGDVTLESEETIKAAEDLFAGLTQEGKDRVSNYKILTEARRECERLKRLINSAVRAIEAIGTVSLESEEMIRIARRAYDALAADGLQDRVKAEFKVLTEAETTYANLYSQDMLAQADALYQSRNYQEALDILRIILNDYSDTAAAKSAAEPAQDCRMKLAESAFTRGKLHEVMTLLDEMDARFEKAEDVVALREKLMTKLENARPKTGQVFTNGVGAGSGVLTVTAGKEDVCIRIYSPETPSKSMMFYVRAGETTEIKISDGEYRMVFTTGKYWYDKTVGFGDEAVYQCITGRLAMTTWRVGSYVFFSQHELNLNGGKNDFKIVDATAEDFWV